MAVKVQHGLHIRMKIKDRKSPIFADLVRIIRLRRPAVRRPRRDGRRKAEERHDFLIARGFKLLQSAAVLRGGRALAAADFLLLTPQLVDLPVLGLRALIPASGKGDTHQKHQHDARRHGDKLLPREAPTMLFLPNYLADGLPVLLLMIGPRGALLRVHFRHHVAASVQPRIVRRLIGRAQGGIDFRFQQIGSLGAGQLPLRQLPTKLVQLVLLRLAQLIFHRGILPSLGIAAKKSF